MEKGKRTKPNQSHIQRPSVRREKKLLLWMMVTAWSVALLGLGLTSVPTQVAAGSGSVLTVVVRDSYGTPLSGVMCEVLSYDWGLKRGQPYTVIAQGESNQNGSVAFDDSSWPNSGYRFRFSPTDHVRPATTYFLPEDQNQYRGYPAAVVGGWGLPQSQSPAQVQAKGQSEYFVVAADGLVYNDLSGGKGSPTFQKDPVGGLDRPRVSPQAMSSQNYLATARAVTATAFAQGVPTKTIPPPPPTFSGVVAAALPITPIPAGPGDPGATATPAPRASLTAGSGSGGNGSNGLLTLPQPTQTPILIEKNTGTVSGTSQAQTQAHKSDALGSVLLAVFGIGCLFMFFVYRWRIYALLGVDQALIDLPRRGRGRGRTKKPGKTKTVAPTPARIQPNRTEPGKNTQTQNQNQTRPSVVTKPETLTSQNRNQSENENEEEN